MMRSRGDADAGGGVRRIPIALLDLTGISDARLRRARVQRISMLVVFAACLVAGIVLATTSRITGPVYFGLALITLGGLNVAITCGGLWRVLQEQGARRAQRDALRAWESEDRPRRW